MNIRHYKKQHGFTLVEIFIAFAIGLVLFSGVISIFVGMSTTTKETSSYGELQENGRFAISVLTDDLLKQNFWGDYSGTLVSSNLISVPAAPGNECVGNGVNNSTFPGAVGNFRTLWGQTVTTSNPMGCFNDAKVNVNPNSRSELIQIKRVIGNSLLVAPAGDYYFTSNTGKGAIHLGGAIPLIDNSRTWQYQHHVYYVREEAMGNEVVPVLMQGRLANLSMNFSPIIDGIEVIRFSYGIDTSGDGEVNTFVSTDNMTNALWDNANGLNKILAVKIFVLARSTTPDFKYTNTSSYQMGDTQVVVNDNYRRLLFTSTVVLPNASTSSWN
mgnify:CR=1 FL=1